MKTWFKFQAKADGAVEVSIFDEIGMWGVTAKNFIAELKAHAGKAITVSINSPGGSSPVPGFGVGVPGEGGVLSSCLAR